MSKNIKKSLQEEREIGFMTNPNPKFVSIVTRGANQIPFSVVKNQKTSNGGLNMKKIIQAIIAPGDVAEDALKTAAGVDELNLSNKSDFGSCVKYEQVAKDVCEADSFELVTLDAEKGIKAVAAELADEANKNFVVNLFKQKKELSAIELPAGATAVEDVAKYVADGIMSEFYAMQEIVYGTLAQSSGKAKDKVAAIEKACSNFLVYLKDNLTTTKAEELELPAVEIPAAGTDDSVKAGKKISKATADALSTVITTLQKLVDVEIEEDDAAKNDDKSLEDDSMKADEVKTMIDEAIKPLTDLTAKAEKSEQDIAGLTEQLTQLTEAVDKLAKSPDAIKVDITDPPEPAPAKVTDTKKSDNPFSGLLFKTEE